MKKTTRTISEAIAYLQSREEKIANEIEANKMYGRFPITQLIKSWLRHEIKTRIFCLNDISEIAMRSFRLSRSQTINLVHTELVNS